MNFNYFDSLTYFVSRNPPSPYKGLKIGSRLILADGGETATAPIRAFEYNDAGMVQAMRMFGLPSFLRKLYTFYIRYIKRDEVYAGLLDGWHAKPVVDFWPLVAKREEYKAQWFAFWQERKLDFVLTVPNALPAVPHEGMKNGFSACGYTFLFNLVIFPYHADNSPCLLPLNSWIILPVSYQSHMLMGRWINWRASVPEIAMRSNEGHMRIMTLLRCMGYPWVYKLLGKGLRRKGSSKP